MELKRIIARDSRCANEKAIQLYGPDVLIISSQRVDQQTELIVAVDVVADTAGVGMPGLDLAPSVAATGAAQFVSMPADKAEFLPFAQVFEMANGTAPPVQPPVAVAETAAEDLQGASARVGAMDDAPAIPMMGAACVPPISAYEQQRSQEIVDMLRQEMSSLRKEFALGLQMQPWQSVQTYAPDILQLTRAMQEVGMPVALRALLTDAIQNLTTLDEAWPVVARLLSDALDQASAAPPTTGVHALCGPSGAGKTSMLGRLAYAAAQVHGAEKQAMICYGEQRPGAWSQLQLLASQAGASCFRAADTAMLQTLLDDLAGKTIWIDTPGTDFAAHAQALLATHEAMGIHAVLPVDATVTNVHKILQNPQIQWSSLMLTKLDEAAYPWPLIKGLCDQPLAVSCMSNDSQINVAPLAFSAPRLVGLAMQPLQELLPEIKFLASPTKVITTTPLARKPRAKKQLSVAIEVQPKTRLAKPRSVTAKAVYGA